MTTPTRTIPAPPGYKKSKLSPEQRAKWFEAKAKDGGYEIEVDPNPVADFGSTPAVVIGTSAVVLAAWGLLALARSSRSRTALAVDRPDLLRAKEEPPTDDQRPDSKLPHEDIQARPTDSE